MFIINELVISAGQEARHHLRKLQRQRLREERPAGGRGHAHQGLLPRWRHHDRRVRRQRICPPLHEVA